MHLDRRNFLRQSAVLGAASLLPAVPAFSKPAAPGYKLLVMATNWGFPGNTDEFCKRAKAEGYDGIEVWWPVEKAAQDDVFAAIAKYGLEVGFLCAGNGTDFRKHAEGYEAVLNIITSQQHQRPQYVNCHAGKDFFTFEQNAQLIDVSSAVSKKSGIPVYHETHRSRMLFAAHVTKQFIEKKPDLRLTLDISHWCNVHESLLEDQQETVALALARTGHIHTRVGHPEGPQVSDPRAPEWEGAVKAHFTWWDEVVKQKRAKGETITMLPEFGAPDYMPTLPYTRQPVANQWAINVHMMQLLKARYGK